MPVDLTQFKRGLIYQDHATASEIASSIAAIRDLDRRAERTNLMITRLCVLSILGVFVSIGCSIAGLVFFIPVAIGCGVLFVAALVYGQLTRKSDLPNRRYELLLELVKMLSRDMPKDAAFDIKLDLAPPNENRKKSHQDKAGGWDITHFEDPWMQLSGRLVDGTFFDIAMKDRYQARKKWVRSRSGKNKLKHKSKSATVATVSLFPKEKKYANLDKVTDRTEQLLRLPSWVRVKKMVANKEQLSVGAVTTEDWEVQTSNTAVEFNGTEFVVTMLLSLYQVLHTSKAVTNA